MPADIARRASQLRVSITMQRILAPYSVGGHREWKVHLLITSLWPLHWRVPATHHPCHSCTILSHPMPFLNVKVRHRSALFLALQEIPSPHFVGIVTN